MRLLVREEVLLDVNVTVLVLLMIVVMILGCVMIMVQVFLVTVMLAVEVFEERLVAIFLVILGLQGVSEETE